MNSARFTGFLYGILPRFYVGSTKMYGTGPSYTCDRLEYTAGLLETTRMLELYFVAPFHACLCTMVRLIGLIMNSNQNSEWHVTRVKLFRQ